MWLITESDPPDPSMSEVTRHLWILDIIVILRRYSSRHVLRNTHVRRHIIIPEGGFYFMMLYGAIKSQNTLLDIHFRSVFEIAASFFDP